MAARTLHEEFTNISMSHYDIIILGSGASGQTLALKLAPAGKGILFSARGGYIAPGMR